MASVTSNRPSMTTSSSTRSSRFGAFTASLANNPAGALQTFDTGESWQASTGIWGTSAIGSGLPSTKREPSRNRDSCGAKPSGSGALTASSEAENPWSTRTAGPWNPVSASNTSPTLPLSSGSNSPNFSRAVSSTQLQSTQATQPSRPPIGHQSSHSSRPQSKNSFDPSSQSFRYSRKPSFALGDDKENLTQFAGADGASRFKLDPLGPDGSFLTFGTNASRENSLPPSRASNSEVNSLGNGTSFASFGHTPQSSISSHRPSFSGISNPYSYQSTNYRYSDMSVQATDEMSVRLAGMGVNEHDRVSSSQRSTGSRNESPSSVKFSQSLMNGNAPAWNDASDSSRSMAYYANYSQFDPIDHVYSDFKRYSDRGPSHSHNGGMNYANPHNGSGMTHLGGEHAYRGRDSRFAGPKQVEMDRRYQNMHFAQQAYLYNAPFPHSSPYALQHGYFPHQAGPAGNPAYGYPNMTMPPYSPSLSLSVQPSREHDSGAGVRSGLLEEFRNNTKSSRRYELKDIYGHAVEFSGDQHGSRFIQSKLETANSDEKEQIFREILPNALQLMTDVFGNYVIQKMFEHGNQVQKRLLGDAMRNHVMELSMGVYGCRVVQKALEYVLANQQAELVGELANDPIRCVKDQNGNHVVQKAIERVSIDHVRFILDAFQGQVHNLATHPYACRVIQRILEYCAPADQLSIMEELHQCASMIVTDQYGNYVTQHVIENGRPEDSARFIGIITAQLLTLSKHKFASNVVEKSIQHGTEEQRRAIVTQATTLFSDGTSPLQLMMKDQYGNYVVQKLLTTLDGPVLAYLIEAIKPQLILLKKSNYGKQIAAIEKIICVPCTTSYNTPPASTSATPFKNIRSSPPTNQTYPIEVADDPTIPMLTNGQNSPQSSSLPSTRGSTIEDLQLQGPPPHHGTVSTVFGMVPPEESFAKVADATFAGVLVHGL